MDKLQWFKFGISDWNMGKIQRCPEITQARFIRLCCLYWNKECLLSIEDAEIEIDKEHLDILISKKIVKISDQNISIDFLLEQMEDIIETSEKRRTSVLKRWNKVKQNDTNEIQNDTSVLQNDTDKIRVDKSIKEKKRKDIVPEFSVFLIYAKEQKPYIDEFSVKAKYESWLQNGWKDGNDKKIVNWKSKLANTLPYLKENKPMEKPDPFKYNPKA